MGRGNQLGFPTANVEHLDTLLPAEGIYAGRVLVDGVAHTAAISIGSNPTFTEGLLKVEAFLLDFQGDLYEQTIAVDFVARLRDIKKFDSVEQLVAQMTLDVQATRQIVAKA